MKRKAITLFLSITVAISAAGCGRAKNNTGSVDNTENQGAGSVGTESVMENSEFGTEEGFNQLQLGNAVEVPQGFKGTEGETDAHGELERLIVEHLDISEGDYKEISYYYNYVDLNGDSTNEILAMVVGESLNEKGGNCLLWLDDTGENLSTDSIMQEFQGVSAPVYISNHMTEGYRDLILCNDNASTGLTDSTDDGNNGPTRTVESDTAVVGDTTGMGDGSNSGYVLLVWNGERYQELSEGTVLEGLQGYEGDAIITNDMEREYREDTYHFLGEAMNL